MRSTTNSSPATTWTGFVDKTWQVHKFGGTSVANADCFRLAANIVEEQLGILTVTTVVEDGSTTTTTTAATTTTNKNATRSTTVPALALPPPYLAVVVSAMGGKPKVTDLLLDSVTAAARRDTTEVDRLLDLLRVKHQTCLQDLFSAGSNTTTTTEDETDRLMAVIDTDLEQIQDILKTVALMKWNAKRISELVSGYGEIWSSQILAALLQQRSSLYRRAAQRQQQQKQQQQPQHSNEEEDTAVVALMELEPTIIQHDFVYLDARRIITIDEDAIMDGSVCWDISQAKLEQVYQSELDNLVVAAKNQSNQTDSTITTMMHFVVTGYVASNTDGVATTLQRDGSDYSAAIMGRLLTSTSVTIWTDVDGVLSADPRRVPMAHAVPDISYNEAMELAYFGAKVIHPKTMQPAISSHPQIPIYIRNTFNSSFRGTRIYTTSTTVSGEEDKCVCGFSSIENMALINVEGSGLIGVPGVAKRMFGTLERMRINVVLISQASSEHSITFATLQEQAVAAKEAIEEEFEKELKALRISNVDVTTPCSIIAAVGDGMSEMAGVSGRFFMALGDAKINVLAIAQGCSERNISAVIMMQESTRALRALHAAFRLSATVVRVAIVGMNALGESLLKLLETQRSILSKSFEIDIQVCIVVPDAVDNAKVVCLKKTDSDDSITMAAYNKVISGGGGGEKAPSVVSFDSPAAEDAATSTTGGVKALLEKLLQDDSPHHTIFDCTNDQAVGELHAEWLTAGVHVVTANNTGLSGSKEQRDAIRAAEQVHGKKSAQYLREVTVGGGLPVITTLRTLLNSGDKIRRVDGILSVSMSYIMFRISPPQDHARCSQFDQDTTNNAFPGDLSLSPKQQLEQVPLSEAVAEAVALGLMEEDPFADLGNEYTARVLMVLAKELGLDREMSMDDIQAQSEKLVESEIHDYRSFTGQIDQTVEARVKAAAERGCVLRHISSVDLRTQTMEIKIMEVPNTHVFAVTPPSCECVRLFTQRYQPYPLILQGPAAGADCTSSALLAELLNLMSRKVGPKTGALARTGSSAFLS